MSGISTHVLDVALGRPAVGILALLLRREDGDAWTAVGAGTTDGDGRVASLFDRDVERTPGIYRIQFETGGYFEASERATFYPVVEVTFEVGANDEHYHVPLLLSPFGYSTYRGS